MKVLEQRPTTSSGLKGRRSRYGLDMPPPAAHISSKPEMVGSQYGWVKIISPEKRWNQSWNHCYVLTECIGCGSFQWQNYQSIVSGKSRGCQNCSQKREVPLWLQRRLSAAKSRCEKPNDRGYAKYGARGILFNFSSVLQAGMWVMKNCPNVKRELELDRIDTNGNYEPGNLRFVPRKLNQANRRITVIPFFNQVEWPYGPAVVTRMLSMGMTREDILIAAEEAVVKRRKNWRIISARLDFMTYEMQAPETVTPYRGNLCTTADMEDLSAP